MPLSTRINKNLINTLRLVAIALLGFLIIYSILLYASVIIKDVISLEYIIPMDIWICLMILMMTILRTKFHGQLSPVAMFAYYFTFGMFMLTLSGFAPIMWILWLLVLVFGGILYDKKGIFGGIVVLSIFIALTWFLDSDIVVQKTIIERFEYLYTGIIDGIFVSILAYLIMILFKGAGISEELFMKVQSEQRVTKDALITMINSMNNALISIDQRGIVTNFNAAALELLDTNVGLTGHRLQNVMVLFDEDGKKQIDLKSILTDRATIRRDLTYKYKNGELINLYMSVAPIYGSSSGEIVGYVFLAQDITKEKTLEEEQNEFISVVSHELRTPVAIAEGAVSNLEFLISKGGDPKSMQDQINSTHEQILYLEKMINDIGTLSRAERGVGAEEEEIDVNELIEQMVAKYTPEAQKQGLRFSVVADKNIGSILSSRLYLEEVLQNFITNAIKYTKKGTVKLTAKKNEAGDKINFAVADSGIGISKTDQKHIFEKFFRSEDFRTRETSGTGLGLYVTSKLAKMLKIDIKVESELDKGSTFSFEMPLIKK